MRRTTRKRNRVSYFEPVEPSFDDYIFCSNCGDYVYEYCSIHGPLLVIPDDEVKMVPSPAQSSPVPPRAALSLPRAFLHLAPTTIPGAGVGVFSTRNLPQGVRFGPYRGVKTGHVTSPYCWQIFDHNHKPSHFLDGLDPNKSNWMRYVNCSRHFSEQNLLAFQYHGQIYYRTIKEIPRHTELLVFYGSEFASELNIDLRRYHSGTNTKTLGLLNATVTGRAPPASSRLQRSSPGSQLTEMVNCKSKEVKETQINETMIEKGFSIINYEPEDLQETKMQEIMLEEEFAIVNRELECEKDTQIQETQLEKEASIVNDEPVDLEETIMQEMEVEKRFPIINHEEVFQETEIQETMLGNGCALVSHEPEDLRETGIQEMEVEERFSTINHKEFVQETQIQETMLSKGFPVVRYEPEDLREIEIQEMKLEEFLTVKCVDQKQIPKKMNVNSIQCQHDENYKAPTQEMQVDIDSMMIAGGNVVQNLESKEFSQNYQSEFYKDNNLVKVSNEYQVENSGEPFAKIKGHDNISANFKVKKYTCPICNVTFATKSESFNHDIEVHNSKRNYKACTICNFKAQKASTLANHMKEHTGKYKCDVCGYETQYFSYFERHKKSHVCKYCNRVFKSGIDKHLKLHTAYMQHITDECPICKDKFIDKEEYITHFKTHPKTHTCEICKKIFMDSYSLNRHMTAHSDIKPYVCDICKNSYKHKDKYKRHMKVHFKGNP